MDESEFGHIARDVRAAALRSALGVGACRDDAEDIAQEATLKLWVVRGDIRGGRHALRLAARAARNMAIDMGRRRRAVSVSEARLDGVSAVAAADEGLVEDERTAFILSKMAILPPKEYELLRLRWASRKSNEEIAQLLGIERASVATMLSRARMRLLNYINGRLRR